MCPAIQTECAPFSVNSGNIQMSTVPWAAWWYVCMQMACSVYRPGWLGGELRPHTKVPPHTGLMILAGLYTGNWASNSQLPAYVISLLSPCVGWVGEIANKLCDTGTTAGVLAARPKWENVGTDLLHLLALHSPTPLYNNGVGVCGQLLLKPPGHDWFSLFLLLILHSIWEERQVYDRNHHNSAAFDTSPHKYRGKSVSGWLASLTCASVLVDFEKCPVWWCKLPTTAENYPQVLHT